MKCPQCTETTLVMTERQGIEIDYCPSCRGVWLDRGELDKLIERSAQAMPTQPPASPQPVQSQYEPTTRRPDFVNSDYKHHSGHGGYQRAGRIKLKAANPTFPEIVPKDGQTIEVWGVVTSTIKQFQE